MFLDIKFNSIAIVLLFLFSITYLAKQRFNQRKYILIFSLLFFFNLLHVYNERFDFIVLESNLSYLIFPLIFFLKPIVNRRSFELILKSFLYCSIAMFLVLLFNAIYIQFFSIGNFYEINWFLFSYHDFVKIINIEPVYASIFAGFSVFISFYFFRNTNKNYFLIFIVILLLFQVMLTSRTPLVATFLILIISIFQTYSFKKSMLLMLLSLIIMMILVSLHSVSRNRLLSTFYGMQSDTKLSKNWGEDSGKLSDRTLKWDSSLEVIKRNPIIGVGAIQMKDSLVREYKKNNYLIGAQKRFDPHNQYLTETLSNGVFSGIALILLLLVPYILALRAKYILYSSFVLLIVFSLFTESVLYRQKGLVFYCFFNALFFSFYFLKSDKRLRLNNR
ncbi:O-antigen ligase family protein [Bizionia saleffrena]|nr:O-antigen ligase family protein [Bizionia saleffrena]